MNQRVQHVRTVVKMEDIMPVQEIQTCHVVNVIYTLTQEFVHGIVIVG